MAAYQYGFIIEDGEIWYKSVRGGRTRKKARSKEAFAFCGFTFPKKMAKRMGWHLLLAGNLTCGGVLLVKTSWREYPWEKHWLMYKDARKNQEIPHSEVRNIYDRDYFLWLIHKGKSMKEALEITKFTKRIRGSRKVTEGGSYIRRVQKWGWIA